MPQDPPPEPPPISVSGRVAPVDDVFEHYRIFRRDDGSLWELGHGSMGVTYKALDTNLDALVALKIINSQFLDKESSRQRFRREARAAASLRHRHVASVYHLGQSGQNFFYAMEFVDGDTVDAIVKMRGPLPWRSAFEIALQVARALMAAHAKNLVHRDIKPANLMLVDEVDEKNVAKLIDFGLAKSAVEEESASLAVSNASGFLGTPLYASPEQCEELPADIRSDIYSLGVTLWFMLTGHPPFEGNLARVFQQQLHAEPPFEKLPPDLPPPARALLTRMLAKERADRPQTPTELREAIEECLRAPTSPTPPLGQPASLPVAVRKLEGPKKPGPLDAQLPHAADPHHDAAADRPPPLPKFTPPPLVPPPKKRKRRVWLLVLLLAGGGIVLLFLGLAIIGFIAEALKSPSKANNDGNSKPTPAVAVRVETPVPDTPVPVRTPEAIDATPGQLPALLARARAAASGDQWQQALTAYDAVLAVDPNSLEARAERGNAYYLMGNEDSARAEFTHAAAITPTDARGFVYRSLVCKRLGQSADCQKAFEAGRRMIPQNAFDYCLRGTGFYYAGADRNQALEDYDAALRQEPGNVRALCYRGYAHFDAAQYSSAADDFTRALAINPAQVWARYNRATAYNRLGWCDRSVPDFDELLRVNPRNSLALAGRGFAYNELGQYARAIQDIDAALRLNPNDGSSYTERGYADNHLGQYVQAIKDLDEAIRLNPRDSSAYNSRGYAYNQQQQFKRAIQDYDEAIKLEPNYAAAFANRGLSYSNLGQYARSMEDFDQAIRLNNKDAVTFCNRGYVNNLMQQYRRAIQDFDAALRLLPNQAATYNNRGFSYSRLKQYDQALKDYTQAITIDPKDAPAYDNRADLEDLMGRPEVAAHDRDTARMLRQQ